MKWITEVQEEQADKAHKEFIKNFKPKNLGWKSVATEPPPLFVKVIRSDARVEGHPEWDNQCIDYLTEDCNTGEVKWFLDKRKPANEFWYPLPEPPTKKS